MTAWLRSVVTIIATPPGLATLKVGELTQMLVSADGNVGSGVDPCGADGGGGGVVVAEEPDGGAGVRGDQGKSMHAMRHLRIVTGTLSLVILVLRIAVVRLALPSRPPDTRSCGAVTNECPSQPSVTASEDGRALELSRTNNVGKGQG